MKSRKYSLDVDFHAPSRFVFDWCTDFREDDYKISGENSRRHVLTKSGGKVVWIQHNPGRRLSDERVRIVTVSPPRNWQLEGFGEEYDLRGKYSVQPKGRHAASLHMDFIVEYKTVEPETAEEFLSDLSEEWERYRKALEKDYKGTSSSWAPHRHRTSSS